MRLSDYFRIAFANITGQKRRCLLIIIITGLMFSLIIAGFQIIQGLQNSVEYQTTRATEGEVLLRLSPDKDKCSEDCDVDKLITELVNIVATYGGHTESVEAYDMGGLDFYLLPASLADKTVTEDVTLAPSDATPVLLSTREAGQWQRLTLNSRDGASNNLATLATIRNQSLGHIIEQNAYGQRPDSDKTKYFVVGLLPSAFLSGISLSSINDPTNLLNLILDNVPLGDSDRFIVSRPTSPASQVDTHGQIWAILPDIDSAARLSTNQLFCDESDKMTAQCSEQYKYFVEQSIGTPLNVIKSFNNIWAVYNFIWISLAVIALIIAFSTYTRLIGAERKNIALYYSFGATKRNVCCIYLVYLIIISFLTIIVTAVIGVLLALLTTLFYNSSLTATFALGFGIDPPPVIMLLGWNPTLLIVAFIILLTAPLSVLLSLPQLSFKNSARNLK